MSGKYQITTYDSLDPRAARLYDWIIRYHAEHGGRRASRAEMRNAFDLSREPLNEIITTLEIHGLLIIEQDDRGKARSYQLPGERWNHPHLTTIESRKVFYPGTLLDRVS